VKETEEQHPNKDFEKQLRLSLAAYRSAYDTYDSAFRKFAMGDREGFRDEARIARVLSQMAQNMDPVLNGVDVSSFFKAGEGGETE
jgi:hypothetical protein